MALARFSLAAPPAPDAPAQLAKPSNFDLQRQSFQKQRESIKAQLGPDIQPLDADSGFLKPMTPLPPPPAQPDCPALASDKYEALITGASKKQSLSEKLIRAVLRQESGFKACAISAKGAQGLMQLMPDTAAQLNVSDPFDPEQNVQAGTTFLKQLLKKYNGDLKLALIAYNAGSGVADTQNGTALPAETQGYLSNILAELGEKEVAAIQDAEKATNAAKP